MATNEELHEQSVARLEAAKLAIIKTSSDYFMRQGSDFCVDCDALIEVARREALPSATRCVGCQEQHERIR